jgi:pimeloyl-ACP methyl ester carboxylesterase
MRLACYAPIQHVSKPLASEGNSTMPSTRRTFVLIHGAWHGGWCWKLLARQLRERGHDVHTPTLTGLGERSHLLSRDIDLDTHIADIVNVFKWEEITDATLVLHSYAGWPGSGAVEQVADRLRALVYLDAFVPEDGQSNLDMQTPERLQIFNDALARGEAGRPAPKAADFAIADPAHVAWVDAKMTQQPLGVTKPKIKLTGARDNVPVKAYIRGAKHTNAHFDRFLKQYATDLAWRTWNLDCGHHVMLDMPEGLADILEELAA